MTPKDIEAIIMNELNGIDQQAHTEEPVQCEQVEIVSSVPNIKSNRKDEIKSMITRELQVPEAVVYYAILNMKDVEKLSFGIDSTNNIVNKNIEISICGNDYTDILELSKKNLEEEKGDAQIVVSKSDDGTASLSCYTLGKNSLHRISELNINIEEFERDSQAWEKINLFFCNLDSMRTKNNRCYTITGNTATIRGDVKEISFKDFHESWNVKADFKHIERVIIPSGVKKIKERTFENCNDLKQVIVSDGVEEIGETAFFGCKNLVSIIISNDISKIGFGAFKNCQNLKGVEIPKYVTAINNGTFGYCTSLESITMTDNVETIGHLAFENCKSLKSIRLSKSITEINNGVFSGCENLQSITIPTGVTSIGMTAFAGCVNLDTVVIPDSVNKISDDAFDKCRVLTIQCNEGSYAESYAKRLGIPTEFIKSTEQPDYEHDR